MTIFERLMVLANFYVELWPVWLVAFIFFYGLVNLIGDLTFLIKDLKAK